MSAYVVISPSLRVPFAELHFRTSRSGGPGGQNVNKLETRVELLFTVATSPSIPENLRHRLIHNLSLFLDREGVLRIVVQDSRSQWKNKQLAIERFSDLLKNALIVPKRRITTKPSKTSTEYRLQSKKIRSERKKLRRVIPE